MEANAGSRRRWQQNSQPLITGIVRSSSIGTGLGASYLVQDAARPTGDLLPVDGDLLGRLEPEGDLVALDHHHGHADVVADDDLFTRLAAQDQHQKPPCLGHYK